MSDTQIDLDALELAAAAECDARHKDGFYSEFIEPAVVMELISRLRAAEAAVRAKLSDGFHPSGVTVLHVDCSGEEMAQLKRLLNDSRSVGQAVLLLPAEAKLENMDEESMRQAGWVRASSS